MVFINADLIAQEISGRPAATAEINAGRLLLARVDGLESHRRNFAFETTLATRMLASRVERWKARGYEVHLIFFWLPSSELAVQRVAGRVLAGGHDVPSETVRRRFVSGLRQFLDVYRPMVDSWRIYDNSTVPPRLIARGAGPDVTRIDAPDLWRDILEGQCA